MGNPGRRAITARGRLFGSDITFDVLALARTHRTEFRAADLMRALDVSQKTVDLELAKLAQMRVLEEAPNLGDRRDRPYRLGASPLARRVLALPPFIEDELLE